MIVPLFDVDKQQRTVEIETGDEKNEEKEKGKRKEIYLKQGVAKSRKNKVYVSILQLSTVCMVGRTERKNKHKNYPIASLHLKGDIYRKEINGILTNQRDYLLVV